ncbi:MAG TPA: metallophosphoesterase [Rhodopila sp.]|nr:metallophosphoesterase [Rhodopila sp.]
MSQEFSINGKKVITLGDPHLGKRFQTGVPMHRRGDRELMVQKQFLDHFANLPVDTDVHVMMGDLFDRSVVSPDTMALVLDAYEAAVRRCCETEFILLRGNHDASRDQEATTSYDIVARALHRQPRVMVLQDRPTDLYAMVFVPWVSHCTSRELVSGYSQGHYAAAFGHWDIVNPSSDTNMVPTDVLNAELFITGHDHKRRTVGDKIIITGSMQPYAHGEDWTGEMYRTVTLTELAALGDTSKMCLRVVLGEDEVLPDDIDAFQITVMRQKGDDAPTLEVGFDGLDMNALWKECMEKHGVPAELSSTLMEQYRGR